MDRTEYLIWLQRLVAEGHMASEVALDLALQRSLFDDNRADFEASGTSGIVGFIAGERLEAETTDEILDHAAEIGEGLSAQFGFTPLMYFEGVGDVDPLRTTPNVA